MHLFDLNMTSAKRIVETRRETGISSVQQLKKMRVVTGQAVPFIWFAGMLAYEKQLSFLPLLATNEDEDEVSLAAGAGVG